MPSLYSITSNANVAVTNTTGLYIGSGSVAVLNNAGQLLTVLDNNGNVNFALDPATGNTTVMAYFTGVIPTAYGNVDVAAYLPTDPTIQGIQASVTAVDGKVTALGNYANVTFTTKTETQTLSANLGAFETYANLAFGPLSPTAYGNANVAVYLPSDPTIIALQSNAGVQAAAINSLNANIGSFYTYANIHFGDSNYGNANVAAYLPTDSTITGIQANLGTATNNITTLFSNAASQATAINTLNANVGAYHTYANANASTQATSINTINANLGAYQAYANANASSQATSINTINANLGLVYTHVNTLDANVGAFETYANLHFGDSNYSNVNVAAYLPTDPTITGIQANIGAFEIATNANLGTVTNEITTLFANAGTQADGINTLNANLGAFETYANATFGTSSYGNVQAAAWIQIDPTIAAIDANIGAFETYANATFSTGGGSTYGNANVAAYLPLDPTITGIQSSIQTLDSNVGAFEDYANVTFVTSSALQTLDANVGLYEIDTNANIGTIYTQLNTLDANVGQYEMDTNANIGTIYTQLNTLDANVGLFEQDITANVGTIYNQLNTLDANVGLYEIDTNANIGTIYNQLNTLDANVGLFEQDITANVGTIYTQLNTLDANVGLYEIDTNANIGTIYTQLNTLDANVGQFEMDISANVGTIQTQVYTLDANIGAFETYANLHFADSNYGNANVAEYLPVYGGNIALGSITNGAYSWTYETDGSLSYSSATAVTPAAGKFWYDDTTGSWNAVMGGGLTTQQIGEELYVYGKANATISGSTILEAVWKTGTVGASGVITFAPTVAGLTNPELIIGVATEDIAINAFGRVTAFGVVHGIDTTGSTYGETWADGDVIWYNQITGGLTNVKPSAPNQKTSIGTVINAGSGGSGSFQVNIQPSTSLGGTDQNVQITSPTSAQILTYDSASQYWKNTNLNAGSGVSIATNANGNLTVSSSFSGNLNGNILYDSVNGRVFANASPLSTYIAYPGSSLYDWISATPTYVNGNLQAPPAPTTNNRNSGMVIGFVQTSNVAVVPNGINTSNRNTAGGFMGMGMLLQPAAWNITDRYRGAIFGLDCNLNGQSLSTAAAAGANAPASNNLAGMQAYSSVSGSGFTISQVGQINQVICTPSATGGGLSTNVQYQTGTFNFMVLASTAGTQYKANVVYSRGFSAIVQGMTANLVVQNAIGYHVQNGWAGSGVTSTSTARNRYAFLNEDLHSNSAFASNVYIGVPCPGAFGTLNANTVNTNANLSVGNGGIYSKGNITINGDQGYIVGGPSGIVSSGNISINGAGTIVAGTAGIDSQGPVIASTYYSSGSINVVGNIDTTGGSINAIGVVSTGNIDTTASVNAVGITSTGNIDTTASVNAIGVVSTGNIDTTASVNAVGITSTGNVDLSSWINLKPYTETINAIGSTSGTVTIDVSLGSVTTLTATGNITINAADMTNMPPGASQTIFITQDGTGGHTLTSNMLFAGGYKTLSTAAGAIDSVTVFYDGTNHLATLVKGYA